MHEFQVIKQLGSGSFGKVLKVCRKLDKGIFAMKTVKFHKLSPREKDSALNEVRLLASIDSPNVIKYKEAFYQDNGSILSIVMEFADGGDLTGLIEKKSSRGERFEENFIWRVAADLLQGLKFLHSNNIIHRDIKPANVFFAEGVAKLGDLNVSKVLEQQYAQTQAGTPYYTAPEIWLGKKYTVTCDIWSLGCLLYEMCCLRPPFTAKDLPSLNKKITSGFYDPVPSKYSKKLAALIKKCLQVNHIQRRTAAQLLQIDVFTLMKNNQEGEVDLLETIRCPRMMRFLNQQLPEKQYEPKQKSMKSMKSIKEEYTKLSIHQNNSKSLKKIRSEKNIMANSIEKIHHLNRPPLVPVHQIQHPPQPQQHYPHHYQNNNNFVQVSNQPYIKNVRYVHKTLQQVNHVNVNVHQVKLPKVIPSQKNIY